MQIAVKAIDAVIMNRPIKFKMQSYYSFNNIMFILGTNRINLSSPDSTRLPLVGQQYGALGHHIIVQLE